MILLYNSMKIQPVLATYHIRRYKAEDNIWGWEDYDAIITKRTGRRMKGRITDEEERIRKEAVVT
jgi:hypothetical protein